MAVPYKLYARMCDLQVEDFEQRTTNSSKKLVDFQDKIGWPWNASKEQVKDWNSWMEGLINSI